MRISIARYLICAICVNAGGTGSYWEHFGSRELKCKELARMSRRWVNKDRSQQAATSRRQRDFCLSIIKSKKGTKIRGIKDRTKEGTKIRTAAT